MKNEMVIILIIAMLIFILGAKVGRRLLEDMATPEDYQWWVFGRKKPLGKCAPHTFQALSRREKVTCTIQVGYANGIQKS